MGALFQVTGIRWRELLRAVWGRALGTNVANRAAELAFWFLMGFFPMLVAVTSMVAMISSRAGSQATLMTYLGKVLPSGAASLVSEVLTQTTGSGKALLSFFFALWSSSSATAGIIDTLNAIYGQTERRPWWKYRVIAVALAIATGILLTVALIIVVYSPIILNKVLPGTATLFVWKLTQWPAAALLLIMALLGIYRFAPNVQQQHWKWLLPGSVTAALIWMAVSLLFKVYVHHFSHFGLLYGSLGALIILMFWFYLSGVAILLGGVINAVLSDAAERTHSGIA
jgi:membrane protein